jgi:hypothetical protein
MIKLTNRLIAKVNQKPHRCKLVLMNGGIYTSRHAYIWACVECGDRYICAKQELRLSMLEGQTP